MRGGRVTAVTGVPSQPYTFYMGSTGGGKPELQTHITYLYQMTNMSDQKLGRDAVERYTEPRRELDQRKTEADKVLAK